MIEQGTTSPDLTAGEAAGYLRISKSTLWRLCRRHKLYYIKYGPRCLRFPIDQLDAYRDSRLVQGPEGARRLVDGRRRRLK